MKEIHVRKLILGLAAAIGVLATIGLSAPANAATTNPDGTITISKGEIQSAMGWNNDGWTTGTDTAVEIEALKAKITTSNGIAPTAPDGGMWYLNGRTGEVTDEWITDPDSFTFQRGWTPVKQYVTPGTHTSDAANGVTAQPVYENGKFKGFKVTSSGFEYWTVHTTYPWEFPNAQYQTFEHNVTIAFPDTDGINGLKFNGKTLTITPAV